MDACKASTTRQVILQMLINFETYPWVLFYMAILLEKSLALPLVDHSILFYIKMTHLATYLFYVHTTRMRPSLSFRRWSKLFDVIKALRQRNYALIRVLNISTKNSLSF